MTSTGQLWGAVEEAKTVRAERPNRSRVRRCDGTRNDHDGRDVRDVNISAVVVVAIVSGTRRAVPAFGLLHFCDVVGLPCLVEERLEWPGEAEEDEPAFAGRRLDPVLSWPAGAVEPKWISIDPSAFGCGPEYVLTDGNGWPFRRIERLSAS